MNNIGKTFKKSDKNRASYHEIKVLKKLYEYQAGVKTEDTASCPSFYLCKRIFPVDSKNDEFLVAVENFDFAYTPNREQEGLI